MSHIQWLRNSLAFIQMKDMYWQGDRDRSCCRWRCHRFFYFVSIFFFLLYFSFSVRFFFFASCNIHWCEFFRKRDQHKICEVSGHMGRECFSYVCTNIAILMFLFLSFFVLFFRFRLLFPINSNVCECFWCSRSATARNCFSNLNKHLNTCIRHSTMGVVQPSREYLKSQSARSVERWTTESFLKSHNDASIPEKPCRDFDYCKN